MSHLRNGFQSLKCFLRGESKNDQRFESAKEMIFEGKWILKAFLLHPILQENLWLNSTPLYFKSIREKGRRKIKGLSENG